MELRFGDEVLPLEECMTPSDGDDLCWLAVVAGIEEVESLLWVLDRATEPTGLDTLALFVEGSGLGGARFCDGEALTRST